MLTVVSSAAISILLIRVFCLRLLNCTEKQNRLIVGLPLDLESKIKLITIDSSFQA